MIGQSDEEWSDGIFTPELHQTRVRLSESLLHQIGAIAQRFLRFNGKLLAHLGAVGERRVHDDNACVLRGVNRVLKVIIVR